jgi:hypothetical protein
VLPASPAAAPLLLICAQLAEGCRGQHRATRSTRQTDLRRVVQEVANGFGGAAFEHELIVPTPSLMVDTGSTMPGPTTFDRC